MSDERVDIILAESPAIFIEDADDDIGVDVIIDNHIEVDVAEAIPIDHGQMPGLGDDDHPQYHNDARGDARYEPKLGNPLVDDYVLSSKTTGVRSWVPAVTLGGEGTTDHGLLTGLGDDDHPHYLTQGRGDARYSHLAHKHAGEDITSGTIDGDRLPIISSTKRGAVPPTSDPPTGKVLSDGNSWVAIGDLYTPFQALTDDDYVDWNLANGRTAKVTLGGNRTLRMINVSNGGSGFLLVRQDGSGGRSLALPAGSLMMEGGAVSYDTAPNARTFLYFEYDGTNYFWHRVREYALPDHNHDAYYVSVVGSPNLTNFPMLNPSGELINGSYGPSDFAAASHNHAATAITSGTLDGDRLPAMSTTKKGAVPPTSDPPTGKVLSDGNSWVAIGDLYNPFQTLTDDEYVDWNLVNGKNARVTLGGNRTLRLTTPGNGMSGFLLVRQDGTGSRTLTLPAGSLMMEGGSLTLDTAPNARTFLYFEYDGTNYFWHRVREYALPDHNHDAYYVSVVGSPNLTNFPMLNPSGELINGSYGPSDFAAASHNHAATAITSGTLDGDRLPAMSTTKKGAVPATGTPSGKFLNDGGSWVGPSSFYATFQTLEDAAPVKWNLLNGYNAKVTLEGNRALSITNASSGMSGLLIVKQDATGGRTLTLPTGSKVLGGGSLTLSTAANAVDILTFVYDGTNYFWSLGKGYA